MQTFKFTLFTVGLVLATNGVSANILAPSTNEIFAKMDSNKDNVLSENEVQGPLKNDFATVDSNGDGTISREELNNAPRPQGRRQQNHQKSVAATPDTITLPVDPALFIAEGLLEPISVVSCTLSDGNSGKCYKIVTKNMTANHTMGPWCPNNVSDDASQGGIWLKDGKVYDVDGHFIKNLDEFYSDGSWKMYDKDTGAINVTKTREECAAAARPDVDAQYQNYCVQCLPSYVGDLVLTYYLPVMPIKAVESTPFGNGPGSFSPSVRGLAFNGIRYDAHAPIDAILSAHTLAPFDDAGGHINLHVGYHYHAATGKTKEIVQSDGHAPMIGYAMDGYGLYANTDADGNEATDLDENRGHYDSVRGYHYHVDKAGSNNFINGLHGLYAEQPMQ